MPSTKQSRAPLKRKLPSAGNWRTSDEDEINKRKFRAESESFDVTNRHPAHPIFSNFDVHSQSGLSYSVEIRDVAERQFACDCVDFRINGLGTCKHVEAVLRFLEARFKRLYKSAVLQGSQRLDLVPDKRPGKVRLIASNVAIPKSLRKFFDSDGHLGSNSADKAIDRCATLSATKIPELRVSQEVEAWMAASQRTEERKRLRREYERKVQAGSWPANETFIPLFPYQREGMLHLAFTERALLADEMGLGKTIQAIAACALLHRMGKAERVLVVTPASLKSEWEEQIQKFSGLPLHLVFGSRRDRLKAYESQSFFTIVNYEQMLRDALEVNERMRPDIVVLDEAQRIKNWNAKTSQAIKRLRSRYAFVLTGTPIENRIDDIHSLMDFLDPSVLGPLFRFNREFYELDDQGRPSGYRNLDILHQRIAPYLLRRRKSDVETELPKRPTETTSSP